MMAQVLFFDIFLEKDPHLNAVEPSTGSKKYIKIQKNNLSLSK